MRRKDIEINPGITKLEIDILDISKDCVVIISNGKAKVRELPIYGEYRIITHQGRVKRMRREEGEEF
ncbi:XtrA/YqaO family protein [Paenibacillus sp. 102]|uniref:XtrA/YqaO family protein n=1 Tax=Paenibacillus sp. 102 TaxID=3120823 RepID=UPI0031BA0393